QAKVRQLRREFRRRPRQEDIRFFDIAMDVSLAVRVSERVERLDDNVDCLFVRQSPALRIRQVRRIRSFNVFTNQVNPAVVPAAFNKTYYVRMIEGGRYVNLAHEATQGLISYCNFRQ